MHNGIQDAGEPGIAGVAVTLTFPDGTTTTTTTNAKWSLQIYKSWTRCSQSYI